MESIDYEHDECFPKSSSYRYLNLGEKSVLELCMACRKHNISYEPFVEDYIKRSQLSKKKFEQLRQRIYTRIECIVEFFSLIDRTEYLGYLVTNKKSHAMTAWGFLFALVPNVEILRERKSILCNRIYTEGGF